MYLRKLIFILPKFTISINFNINIIQACILKLKLKNTFHSYSLLSWLAQRPTSSIQLRYLHLADGRCRVVRNISILITLFRYSVSISFLGTLNRKALDFCKPDLIFFYTRCVYFCIILILGGRHTFSRTINCTWMFFIEIQVQ